MELPSFDLEELYLAVKEKALAEGAVTPESWSDIIDGTLQEREERGDVDDDDELSAVKEQLKGRFEEFKAEISEA